MTKGDKDIRGGTPQGSADGILHQAVYKQIQQGLKIDARRFFRAVEEGNVRLLKKFLENGYDVNEAAPKTKATALHYAAAYGARASLRLLLKTGKCDFLKRDGRGRLPSELAFVHGHDPAMARLLRRKEKQQARAQGIKLRMRDQDGKPRPLSFLPDFPWNSL